LTGNRNVIVPNTVQQYWVANNTTGSYTFTVKTAAGTGVSVAITLEQANNRVIAMEQMLVAADTGGVSIPVAISRRRHGRYNCMLEQESTSVAQQRVLQCLLQHHKALLKSH
jgi:outer membrane protein assembly factor BamB